MVSSNVVTETLNKAQATPILQATPLASAIFVSQYSNLFSLSLFPLGGQTRKNYCAVVIRFLRKIKTKSEARVSKFYWNDLSLIFLATMLLHSPQVF